MLILDETKLRAHTIRQEKVKGLSSGFLETISDPQDKSVKPEFIVKNMSYDELQKAIEDAGQSLRLLKEDLPKEKSGNDIVDSLMLLIKTCKQQSKELSHDTLYRISLIKYGTVSPTISHTGAVLIATHFGMDFKKITDEILILSQMGSSFPKKK